MKAIVYYGNKDIRLENVPEPVPGNSEVKIRVEFCGICATDIEEYQYGPNFIVHDVPHPLTGKTLPIITGHELTGTVVEIASDVTNVNIGERVVIFGCISCLDCWWCRNDAQV
jgi:(R,R)-butanediol dehydrogenase/meso-butanediol dehydrogenase/diacetyl reductase